MGAKDEKKVYRVLGDLYHTPTNLDTAPGTSLGVFDQFIIRPMKRYAAYEDNDSSRTGQKIEVLNIGESYEVGVSLRQWDNDAVRSVVTEFAAGPLLAHNSHPDVGRVTTLKLFLRARNYAEHPSLLLYAAAPVLIQESELLIGALDELVLECVFYALPDANGYTRAMGLGASLTVSP